MEKVTKYFKSRIKGFGDTPFTADVILSDESVDRYKERVLVNSFSKTIPEFMKHPVLLSSHGYRGLMQQIGKFNSISIDEENKEVVGNVTWFVGEGNPEADWGWKLAEKGVAAFSIGFIAKKYINNMEDEEKMAAAKGSMRDYTDIELLETSQVLIPANRNALMKSFDDAKEDDEKAYYEMLLDVSKDYVQPDEEVVPPAVVEDAETKTNLEEADDMVLMSAEFKELLSVTINEILKIHTEAMAKMIVDKINELGIDIAELKKLGIKIEEKTEEKPEEVLDQKGAEDVTLETEVIGEEKVSELRDIFFREKGEDVSLKASLEEMINNLRGDFTKKFSVQS